MAGLLGIKLQKLDYWRDKCGHQYEKKEGRTVFLHGPEWLAAYFGTADRDAEDEDEQRLRKLRIKAETSRYLKELGELVRAADVAQVFGEVAIELSGAIEAISRTTPAAAERMTTALDSAREKIVAHFHVNDHANIPAADKPAGKAGRKADRGQQAAPTAQHAAVRRRGNRGADRAV